MEWSEERILEFLELFQKEELIWNPKHRNHKNRQKLNDAWNRISATMGLSVNNLKIKKNSLMACFRTHLRKKKSSMKSGMGEEDVYEPIWFAFKFMEDFLAPVYDCGDTIDTEDNISSPSNQEQHVNEQQNVSDQTGNTEDQNIEETDHNSRVHTQSRDTPSDSPATTSQRQKRRQLASEISDAQKKIKQTFETLNNVISQKKRVEDDDCDLYGKLLANKLRNYSKHERYLIMHEIDGFLLKKPPGRISNISYDYSTSSPAQDSADSLPQSPVQINTPNQPFLAASYVDLPSQSPIHRSSSVASSYGPMLSQSPVQISIPNRPSSPAISYAPLQSQSRIRRPSSDVASFTAMPKSPVQIRILNRPPSVATSYASFQLQSPIHILSSAASSFTPVPSQSPVQISIPNRPPSVATSYASFQSQSPIRILSSAASSFTPVPSQSSVQISIPNRPPSAATSYASFQSHSPIHRPSSAASSYTPVTSHTPVQISIPNTPSSAATSNAPFQSQSPDQISILNYQPMSEEVISPSINILQHALTNAEIDESDFT